MLSILVKDYSSKTYELIDTQVKEQIESIAKN